MQHIRHSHFHHIANRGVNVETRAESYGEKKQALDSFDTSNVVVERDSTQTTPLATTSCAPNDNSGLCQKPTDDSATLPIALGAGYVVF